MEGGLLQITSTIYVPSQGRLVSGREDGSIVIVAAVCTLMLHLMDIPDKTKGLQNRLVTLPASVFNHSVISGVS